MQHKVNAINVFELSCDYFVCEWQKAVLSVTLKSEMHCVLKDMNDLKQRMAVFV